MQYELTIVLDGATSAAKKKATLEKVTKLVEFFGGKVGKMEDLGVKDLAYKIGKSETGIFAFLPLELDAKAAKSLGDKIRLEEGLIRYLLIKKD